MKMRRVAFSLVGVIALTAVIVTGCVPEKKKKASVSLETMEQNALEAEKAEMEMAQEAPAHKEAGHESKKVVSKKKTSKVATKVARMPASVEGSYVVQIGAFKVKENAERLNSKLQGEGYKTVFRSINHSKNGELYLVHLEPTKDRSEAEAWASKLKAGSIDTQLLRR